MEIGDTKPNLRSPNASENYCNTSSTQKEPTSSQLEDVQSPETLIKRRRTMSFNDVQTSSRNGHMYHCRNFNYYSNERASLTRHASEYGCLYRAAETTPPMARYCANCNIQFYTYKNYKIHKEVYCNTRHVHKSTSSSFSNTSQHPTTQQQIPFQPRSPRNQPSPTDPSVNAGYNMALNQLLYADISTSPLILVPCSYVAGACGLSPNLVPAGNFVIPNPQVLSPNPLKNVIPTFTVIHGAEANQVQPSKEYSITKLSEAKGTSASKEVRLKIPMQKDYKYKDDGKNEEDMPLDLSLCKNERDKKCLPSRSMAQSGLQRTSSPRDESSIPPNLPTMPPHNSELMETDSGLVLVLPPPIVVKKCVNKCMDCNVVFYKLENYLVHKKKYCPARCSVKNREEDSPDKSRNSSSTPERDETNE